MLLAFIDGPVPVKFRYSATSVFDSFNSPLPETVSAFEAVPDKETSPVMVCVPVTERVLSPRFSAVISVNVFAFDKVISPWKVAELMFVPDKSTAPVNSAVVIVVFPPPFTTDD